MSRQEAAGATFVDCGTNHSVAHMLAALEALSYAGAMILVGAFSMVYILFQVGDGSRTGGAAVASGWTPFRPASWRECRRSCWTFGSRRGCAIDSLPAAHGAGRRADSSRDAAYGSASPRRCASCRTAAMAPRTAWSSRRSRTPTCPAPRRPRCATASPAPASSASRWSASTS